MQASEATRPAARSAAQPAARPLKFVFYRPHANIWFKNPVRNILKGQRLPNKYEPFFDHVLASSAQVYFTTSLIPPAAPKALLKWLLEPAELMLWCWLNKLPLRRVRLLFTAHQLAGKDVLFLMHYGTFTAEHEAAARSGARLARILGAADIFKVVHMTHYAYCPSIGAENLGQAAPDLLVAENDLAKNSAFFKRFFGSLSARFRTLPYTPAARFERKAKFEDRIDKVVATGSITFRMRDPEFVDFFGFDELQPLRRALFENADALKAEMECLISDLNASRESEKDSARQSLIGNWVRKIARRWGKHPQMNYYRRNIVDVYNTYTMFVVPEEICNLPAIGFVEGMACGCAYLGIDDPMYRDLGMFPGVHYVGYDGTPEGLAAAVREYQQGGGRERLKSIAEAGHRLVADTLTAQRVYDRFLAELQVRANSPRAHG